MKALIKAVAFTALFASPLLAQSAVQRREGFTGSFGLGIGSAGATCDGCDSDREWAPSMYLRLGGAYRPNLILGGEINGWSKTTEEENVEGTLTIATINAIAQWYPQPTSGFFIDGGLGLGTMNVEIEVPGLGNLSSRTTGLGYQVGVGYDVRLRPNLSLTPYATFFGTAGGKVENSNNDAKVDGNVLQFGLGLTWH